MTIKYGLLCESFCTSFDLSSLWPLCRPTTASPWMDPIKMVSNYGWNVHIQHIPQHCVAPTQAVTTVLKCHNVLTDYLPAAAYRFYLLSSHCSKRNGLKCSLRSTLKWGLACFCFLIIFQFSPLLCLLQQWSTSPQRLNLWLFLGLSNHFLSVHHYLLLIAKSKRFCSINLLPGASLSVFESFSYFPSISSLDFSPCMALVFSVCIQGRDT